MPNLKLRQIHMHGIRQELFVVVEDVDQAVTRVGETQECERYAEEALHLHWSASRSDEREHGRRILELRCGDLSSGISSPLKPLALGT